LIGTTDIFFSGNPTTVAIEEAEIDYLCDAVQAYFTIPINKDDIIHTYSGVRPLSDNKNKKAAELSRDYVLELNTEAAPILSVLGGKITTYRKLSEKAVNLISHYFPNISSPWTEKSILPGGDLCVSLFNYMLAQAKKYNWLPKDLLHRYVSQYGTLVDSMLKNTHSLEDLGKHYGAQLYQKEVEYLIKNEWAYTSEDILWRRTKLGYFFPKKCTPLLDEDLKNMVC
jgi:glycerol-3-phosphate dehydrogenase